VGKNVSTYIALFEMEACDADAIQKAVCDAIEKKGLNITKIVGLGSNNASVMVGINNGVYNQVYDGAVNKNCYHNNVHYCFYF